MRRDSAVVAHMVKRRADIVNDVIQAVAELPDRTSPEDWPDAMLVTADELRAILLDRLSLEPTSR